MRSHHGAHPRVGAVDVVPFIPLGEYWHASAYRNTLTDVTSGCFATFYGVRRA